MTAKKPKFKGKKIRINGKEVVAEDMKHKLPEGKSQNDVVREHLKKLGKKVV